mmetsp:Transcript_16005/g.29311  ORF Transcript_16005/g.29311 Transcript_16005/m.29311 type:complete len:345 (-) Transcript_16005:1205-2239(-)|eukprot:CAMPEP_0204897422 /NCGR_PEP_ID=MMETSP1397-20131031/731_1 /ASSEMBLY_ACC=CAM_ASM_000891 /TAXON_ID=49980 /ORGANISM="Climacostomum Climacostomum virens, Strain Stock W-24" /LENGTH=344 /DNA_ID=CAMNT_0052065173 /DNA_START=231 /DNA_END=1265 /DNA_ORIENTATION=-
MGGSKSKSDVKNFGEMQVFLENNVVSSGEDLIGTVGLLVTQTVQQDTIYLEFFGESEVEWYISVSDGDNSSTEKIEGKWTQICYKTPLFVWPDRVITPGQYNLPFIVKIPPGLPSSLSWSYRSVKAKISYKLSVWIIPGVQDSIEVTVHQKEGLPIHEPRFSRSANVSLLCFGRGQGINTAALSRTAYYVGEKVTVTVNYDFTNSKSRPHSYDVQLKYHLTLFDPTGVRMTHGRTLDSSRGICADPQGTLVFELKTKDESIAKLSTVHTKNIVCEFFVVVTPRFNCCVCAGGLSSEIRFIMTSKHSTLVLNMPPENWEPTVFKHAILDINEIDATAIPSAPPYE